MIERADIPRARQRLQTNQGTQILLFEAYSPHLCKPEDAYLPTLLRLEAEGLHRNVYGIDAAGDVTWCVADYHPEMPDHFVEIQIDSDGSNIIAHTFQGFRMSIDPVDGVVTRLGWDKS